MPRGIYKRKKNVKYGRPRKSLMETIDDSFKEAQSTGIIHSNRGDGLILIHAKLAALESIINEIKSHMEAL